MPPCLVVQPNGTPNLPRMQGFQEPFWQPESWKRSSKRSEEPLDRGASSDHTETMTETKATATSTGTCIACGRPLRSAASVARGMGPTCARKVRIQLDAYLAVAGSQAWQVEKARNLILAQGIRATNGGYFARATEFAAVSSRGDATYYVDVVAGTCSCPGGSHGRMCYQLIAGLALARVA